MEQIPAGKPRVIRKVSKRWGNSPTGSPKRAVDLRQSTTLEEVIAGSQHVCHGHGCERPIQRGTTYFLWQDAMTFRGRYRETTYPISRKFHRECVLPADRPLLRLLGF